MVGISFAPHAAAVKMCWGKLLVEMNVWYVEWEAWVILSKYLT